jgi:alkanesulfonate monooxygenase SsuD/methylene tetrahydromethanopterin reductase-like flavin-dependent oxidoreductase (luciferase family)
MKFSLFFEMQVCDPNSTSESQLFRDCVDQAVAADALGYHCVWVVEHHGLYEYSHSSAPEVFLAFVAGRTTRVRLGHGVTLTPGRFNHPIRIAERVATLDVLSGGRVNWGSGRSSSNVEANLFEIDHAHLWPQWEEALHMIPRMWQNPVFSWNGTHYRIPPTHIVPKPVQWPHPPLFAPAAHPEAVKRLGQLGVGALHFSTSTFDELRERVRIYKEAVASAAPVGWAKNDHFAVTANTCVLDDDDEACRYGFRGARYFRDALDLYYRSELRPSPGPLPLNRRDYSRAMLSKMKAMRSFKRTELLSIIGNPAVARMKVERFRQAGVDELIFVMQLGTVPHDIVMRSIRCCAEAVMPHFDGDASPGASVEEGIGSRHAAGGVSVG